MPPRPQNRRIAIAVLLLMSLLRASSPLRSLFDIPGNSVPPIASAVLPLAVLTILATLLNLIRHPAVPNRRLYLQALPVSLALFVFPALLRAMLAADLGATGRTALLTLVPLFALVLEPHLSSTNSPSPTDLRLLAALAGLAGALLLFPGSLPSSGAALIATIATVVTALVIAAATCRAITLAESRPFGLTTIIAAESAVSLTLASLVFERTNWSQTSLADALTPPSLLEITAELAAIALFFWLLDRLSPAQLTTSYLLAPLLAVTIGAALLRAPVEPHSWLGLALMAIAAISLVRFRNPASESNSLSLL